MRNQESWLPLLLMLLPVLTSWVIYGAEVLMLRVRYELKRRM